VVRNLPPAYSRASTYETTSDEFVSAPPPDASRTSHAVMLRSRGKMRFDVKVDVGFDVAL